MISLYMLSVWVIPLVTAITLHEAAHGYVAWMRGDDTARRMGRVSLNPLRHVDPFGTLILPTLLMVGGSPVLFGYAKPVPVNFQNLRNPRTDTILVAAAGPATNLLIAFIAGLVLYIAVQLPPYASEWLTLNGINAIRLNAMLAVFNLLPILPLDGGRILAGFLPPPLANTFMRLERFGMVFLIALLFVLPLLGLNIFPTLVGQPATMLARAVLFLTGHEIPL